MKITMHENSWTPIITEFDIRTATQDEINKIAKLECEYTVVVIKDQHLTVDDEVKAAGMFGAIEEIADIEWTNGKIVPGSDNLIMRISGAKDENGLTGAWPEKDDIEWHADSPGVDNRPVNTLLYAISGSKGSRTSFANTKLAYDTATPEQKEVFDDTYLYVRPWVTYREESHELKMQKRKLVVTNAGGFTGMFFPGGLVMDVFRSAKLASNKRENLRLLVTIRKYILQEQFIYHHDWEDGDLVLSCQELGIHKRWAFEGIEDRLLHRIGTHLDKIDFNTQD